MKIIPSNFSKIDFIRQIITCLLAIIFFLTMLSSVAKPGPKGKAVGHNNIHGNGPIPMINGRINPAGIIVGSGGVKINGVAAAKPGNTSNQSGMGNFSPANNAVNPAGIIIGSGGVTKNGIATDVKHGNASGQSGMNSFSPASGGMNSHCNKVFSGRPGSNVVLMFNSQSNGVLGNMNKGKGAGGKGLTLAAGDVFCNAILNVGSLSASVTLPDPIGAKGPNPNHGGSHPKKGGGNPGGGNGNGHWGWGNHGNGNGNTFMGNQGKGVGEGMARKGPFGPPEPPEGPGSSDPPEEPGTPEPLDNPTTLFVEAAPIPKDMMFKMGQCPALMALAAEELGVSKDDMQVHLVNALADSEDINPCHTYSRLANCAAFLRDPEQVGTAALTKVINEIVSPTTPISEELLASVSQALATHRNTEDKPYYRLAGQWLDVLGEYVSILTTEMQWSEEEAIAFVGDKYVVPVMEEGDVSLAMFLHLQLQALGSS